MLTYTGSLWQVDSSVCMCYKHYIKCFCWFRHFNWMWHDLDSQCRVRIQCQIQIYSLEEKKKKNQYTRLTEYYVRGQSHTQTTFPLKWSWGTSEASFITTLPCIQRVTLWHTAQGRCDHGDIVPPCIHWSIKTLSFHSVFTWSSLTWIQKKKKRKTWLKFTKRE